MKFILASGSPRRLELLQQLGLAPEVVVSSFSEVQKAAVPEELVKENAFGKGKVVAAGHEQDVVIAADTIVVADNKILGKPADAQEAAVMLQALSGKKHQVLTGVAVFYQGSCKAVVETTDVEFYELSPELISAYVSTGEPLDKAGAYGIQGKGAVLVKGINGDYSNVVGLPLGTLCRIFTEMGVLTGGKIFNQESE